MADAQERDQKDKMDDDQTPNNDEIGYQMISGRRKFPTILGDEIDENPSNKAQGNPDDEMCETESPNSVIAANLAQKRPFTFNTGFKFSNSIEVADDQSNSEAEMDSPLFVKQVEVLRQKYNWLENASDTDWNFKNIANFRDCPLLGHLIELKELATSCLNNHLIEKEVVIKIDAIQLRFLLKTIQFAKISGRNLALEEMEKLFTAVGYQHGYHHDLCLNVSKTFDDLVSWFRENDVLGIMLRDNLHLMAFVERIEKILMLLIRRKVFRVQDLDQIWTAFWGKHDVVQRNMLMMISEIARSFNIELIDRFFELMKVSFKESTSNRERSLLLEVCRNLILGQSRFECDVFEKAFDLTWELYHHKNLGLEIIDVLLNIRGIIVNAASNFSSNGDYLRSKAFYQCLEEIKNDSDLVVPLFTHIQHICCEPFEKRKRFSMSRTMLNIVVNENTISHIVESICRYLEKAKRILEQNGISVPLPNSAVRLLDSIFLHNVQMAKRLESLHFFISECSERQCYPDTKDIQQLWKAVVEHPVSDFERQKGFHFFGSNLSRFLPETNLELFYQCLLNFPPKYFSVSAFNEVCVMLKRSHVESLQNQQYNFGDDIVDGYMENARDYLWKVILEGSDQVFFRAIEFSACEMENMNDPEKRNISSEIFINECFEKLKNFSQMIEQACTEELGDSASQQSQRVIKALKVLLMTYENSYGNWINMPVHRGIMGVSFNVFLMTENLANNMEENRWIHVNSNFTMDQFYQIVYERVSKDRKMDSNEKLDLLNYRIPNGMPFGEGQIRVMHLLSTMRNEKMPPINVNIQDVLRFVGSKSMKKTFSELHIDENSIFAVRFGRSRRDTSSFNFVSSMTRGDTPESSGEESEENEGIILDEKNSSIVLSNNRERIFFLMDLAELAHKRKKNGLFDDIILLLDHLTVTDYFKEELEKSIASNCLLNTVIHKNPSKTCFYFQILHTLMAPVKFSENCVYLNTMFLLNNCIEDFFNFFESTVIDGNGYSSGLNTRILLAFSRMVKFVSRFNKKLLQIKKLVDTGMDIDSKNDEDSYFSDFIFEFLKMAWNDENKKILLEKAEKFTVPVSILKILFFASWTATRGNIHQISSRNPPSVAPEVVDCDLMDSSSTSSDTESTMSSSFMEDLINAKFNDRNEFFCEMLSIEALDAFLDASRFCNDVKELFFVPDNLVVEFKKGLEKSSAADTPEVNVVAEGPKANSMIDVMFAILPMVENNYRRSNQYFECLFQLMNYCQLENIGLEKSEEKFEQILKWLKNTRNMAHEVGLPFSSGQDMNTREQQDAVEFFNSLADALDEVFKASGGVALFEKFFGGTLSDQKKCRDCPHIFMKEQLFTSIAVDVRSHNNLRASLNEYVTGDLLEGDNAYFCEICKEKVTCVKRMCVKKLPPFLVFQLKRFDMDWNRNSPVKFFDYFDFPMTLDMEPYTTAGVEKNENQSNCSNVSNCDTNEISCEVEQDSTIYKLRGVVVHSGEANGGHYYSFISEKKEGKQFWYRFDDTEVTSWDYNENDARFNWYGGYNDGIINEKEKRRFSAYMLVYESVPKNNEVQPNSSSTNRSLNLNMHSPSPPCIPSPNMNSVDLRFGSMSIHSRRSIVNRLPYFWEKEITKNNLKFAHEKFQFTTGYFRFLQDLTRLAALQSHNSMTDEIGLAERALHIFSCFLYTTAIRCPNDFRKNIDDLFYTFDCLVKNRPEVCTWFMSSFFMKTNVIPISLGSPYLSGCELRTVFERMVYVPIMVCLNATESNSNANINPTADRIVDEVIAKMLQLCKTIPSDSSNNSNIFKVLILISHHSISGARRLISQNALYSMISIFGAKDDSKYRMRFRDLDLVFELLIREMIKIEDRFQSDRIKIILLGHEKGKVKGLLTECGYLANLNHNNKVFPIVFEFLNIWEEEPKVKEILKENQLLIPALKSVKMCIEKVLDSRNSRMILNLLRIINEKWNYSFQLNSEKECFDAVKEIIHKIEEIMNFVEKDKETEESKTVGKEENPSQENPPSYESIVSDELKNEGSSASGHINPYLPQHDDESDPLTSPITFHCSRRDSNSSTCVNGAPEDDEYEDDFGDSDDMNGVEDGELEKARTAAMVLYNNDVSAVTKSQNSPLKAGKKRHLNPPTSVHGSSSSLPSYEMPTSRKVRHEQSPHTSPVKIIPTAPPPSYEECVKHPVSPMETDEDSPPGSGYTGRYSSDGPPSA
ncbi:hypothetical protein FO519_003477 [Halicephalobus sp. NKZ332]|nr:hypothetical protein FO519_003477 [Halicephalobus sp. NKZ332]